MRKTLSAIETIDSGRISRSPFFFRFTLPGDGSAVENDRKLIESIEKHGVINPPLVLRGDGMDDLIVLGHRRMAAAWTCGLKKVEALIVETGGESSSITPDEQIAGLSPANRAPILSVWLEDAGSGRPLNDFEKLKIAGTVVALADESLEEMVPSLSALFRRRLSTDFIRRASGIVSLGLPAKAALASGTISIGDLLQLHENPLIDTAAAVELLATQDSSRGENREAVRLMLYLADQGEKAWKDFVSSFDGGSQLTEALRKKCFPRMDQDTAEIDRLIRMIALPTEATLQPPPNLEGGSYALKIRVRKEKSLHDVLLKVLNAVEDGTIGKLLDILGGKGR